MSGGKRFFLVVCFFAVPLFLGCISESEQKQLVSEDSWVNSEQIGSQSTYPAYGALSVDEHSLVGSKNELPIVGEECCDDPGQLTECWMDDAQADGVTCTRNSDCPSNSCNESYGLCECTEQSDCGDGVCTSLDLCGPSYCNGFKICSCWGGCTQVTPGNKPQTLCEADDRACCNGTYPIHPDLREGEGDIGFCSSDYTCDGSEGGHACETYIDCPNDGVDCTVDTCDSQSKLCSYQPNPSSCDDGNQCTNDTCDAELGCAHVNRTGTCNDGNACTINDTCSNGTCTGTARNCSDGNSCTDDTCDPDTGCTYSFNTNSCNDGDACTVSDVCSNGICAGTARNCSDGNSCTSDSCNPATGCVYTNLTGACSDEDACTIGDVCSGGVCVSGAAANCNDSNSCTNDTCNPASGCVHANNTSSCSDGNACTGSDTCSGGSCQPGAAVSCDDSNLCTDDTCNPASGCVFNNNSRSCNDSDACTSGDVCSGGSCSGEPLDCDDSNDCTLDSCDTVLGCTYEPGDLDCDDGNACSADDRCSLGDCSGVLIYWRFEEESWDGTENEVIDSMDNYHGTAENECNTIADGKVGRAARFEHGNGHNVGNVENDYHVDEDAKTLAFWVKFDSVTGAHQTVGSAEGAGKRFYLGIDRDNNIFAGYGNAFVGWSKSSVPSGIVAGVWVRMAMTYDGESAHVYVNDVELISFEAEFVGEGQGPVFFLGTGEGNVALDEVVVDQRYWDSSQVAMDYDNGNGPDPEMYARGCDDDNDCTDDSCDKELGCVHEYNTDSCNDGSVCTEGDVCGGGVCSGEEIACGDSNTCTDDSCDPVLGCIHTNNEADCDDDDECTTNDVCFSGVCEGTPLDCNDLNDCTDDTCVEGFECVHFDNTESCDDGNVCTEDDVCSEGSCTGDPVSCNDQDPCTQDECAPATGCSHTPIEPCDQCSIDSDCIGQVTCSPQPVGCSVEACIDGECICNPYPPSTTCSDYSVGDYPSNCYSGLCDGSGVCVPVEHAAQNNLCSDVFVTGQPTVIDTTVDSYMGAIANTVHEGEEGALLSVTGSTQCANNNYYSVGDECNEKQTSNHIGAGGPDLIYVFQYETNSLDQYELYSYNIKVQADYDVGIYIRTDISQAGDCPEGNNPGLDEHSETFLGVTSNICTYPYQNSPMPPVIEDECDDQGNELNDQTCCDPCIEGSSCGYKWCKRGYNYNGSSCDMCAGAGGQGYNPWTFKGNCDALWVYPDDPFSCSSQTPGDPGYSDYDYMANAVISPDGVTTGSWRTVFIFVDGVSSSKGNFYLTVEKQRWWASPCDRVNDDGRVYDVTHVGSSDKTFIGTLEKVTNSVHADTGSCGGYSCTAGWSGKTSCHASGSANQFWPNAEFFKIQRSSYEGSATYCFQTDESVTDAADLVVSLYERRSSGLTICDESYTNKGCKRNNSGDNAQWEFTASAGRLYLLAVSQYALINRLCTPSAGDDCKYKITVTEGNCPVTCVDPSTWYSSSLQGTVTANGTTFAPSSTISGDTTSSSNSYDATNWSGNDNLWKIEVTAASTVQFSCCDGSGSCFNKSRIKLYDCLHNEIASDVSTCGSNRPKFSAALSPDSSPYYLLVDGKSSSYKGSYTIQMTYQ